MRRVRIERLEERKMFSVTDLILDPFNSAVSANVDEPTAIVDFIDPDEVSTPSGGRARTESVGKDESITIGGARTESIALRDMNFDGRADGITPTYNGDLLSVVAADFNRDDLIGRSNLIIVVCSKAPGASQLLPYIEQDNVHNIADVDDAEAASFVTALYTDLLGRPTNFRGISSMTDGSSNTMMFAAATSVVPPINIDLPGLLVDTSPIELSIAGLDTWEHAYRLQHGAATNGIIAILIGLTADPSDPSGNTVYAVGSPRSIRVDTTGMADIRDALVASNEYRSNAGASLLGSAEYFSRFTNTTFDDEATAAVTVNWGDGASQVTHDKEFENWANVSRFDRSYLSPGLADVLVSSILHEDNEFSFPRMTKAGAAIMAEWTSTRD